MSLDALPCEMKYIDSGDSECILEFYSSTEGVATTFANLYRRMLLQSVPRMSVAGIKCVSDGKIVTNLFQIVNGMTNSLIEVNQVLHNSVFDIDSSRDSLILHTVVDDVLYLSDLCDRDKCAVIVGDDVTMRLVSEDSVISSVVGNHTVEFYIYLRKDIGYVQKDVNMISLKNEIGEKDVKDWIISDSQHRGVPKVQYKSEVQLDRQVVTLHVTGYGSDMRSVVSKCTDDIINQVSRFKLSND